MKEEENKLFEGWRAFHSNILVTSALHLLLSLCKLIAHHKGNVYNQLHTLLLQFFSCPLWNICYLLVSLEFSRLSSVIYSTHSGSYQPPPQNCLSAWINRRFVDIVVRPHLLLYSCGAFKPSRRTTRKDVPWVGRISILMGRHHLFLLLLMEIVIMYRPTRMVLV